MRNGRRALITGITGQDGSYLAELLLEQGYEVHGMVRDSSPRTHELLERTRHDLTLHSGDLLDQRSLADVLRACEPHEIYNLAAMSIVAASWSEPVLTAELSGVAVTRVLEAMRQVVPQARFCQASSSEMFGRAKEVPQSERTPMHPRTPYGAAKAYGHLMTVTYRESFDLYCCSGILFNHESPRRGPEFVARKITRAAAAIKLGLQHDLLVGNLRASRDWGYAKDYVKAMWLMLQQYEPDDYVIGTGRVHTVLDLVELAFAHVDLDPFEFVVDLDPEVTVPPDPRFERSPEVNGLVADSTKARERLGWEPETRFEELVSLMVDADLELLSGGPREANELGASTSAPSHETSA